MRHESSHLLKIEGSIVPHSRGAAHRHNAPAEGTAVSGAGSTPASGHLISKQASKQQQQQKKKKEEAHLT